MVARRAAGWISGLSMLALISGSVQAEDWSERVEFHGFVRSSNNVTIPNLRVGRDVQLSSSRQELNLEATAEIFSDEKWNVSGVAILRPTYDLVYDLYPHVYGDRARSGQFGTQLGLNGFTPNPKSFRDGDRRPGAGGGIEGAFTYINQDIAFLFTNDHSPGIVIDNEVFYGQTIAPSTPRGTNQTKLGGAATVGGLTAGAAAFQTALANSAGLASLPLSTPLRSPAQIAAGTAALGDRRSLDQSPFDPNRTEGQLQNNCFDGAHPWCFVRELYFDIEHENTLVRIGKQQIVWGKTDAFRMQDIINPLDLGIASIFVPLEERRIPQLALDVTHGFGDLGPIEDASLEFVWVVDRFTPVQVGQCGEPRAFTAGCEGRIEAASHGLFNFSLAEVKERDWQLRNTEPGLRFEGRLADPAISFSLSAFWGIQDQPVPRLKNAYSTSNANPAAILFLQGLGVGSALQTAGLGGLAPNFTGGFDPYDLASINATALELRTVWGVLFGPGGALCNASLAASAQAQADCITASGLQLLDLPFSGGQVALEYPRTLTLGGSLDYQVPNADAILNLEMAYDVQRYIPTSANGTLIDKSGVISAAVGVDWSPFIPIFNRTRTTLLGAQMFAEHILDYDDDGNGRRMIPDENQLLSTLFMQNYWRNDSLILTNFAAWDWNAQALAWGPSLKWIYNDNVSIEVGAQMIWARRTKKPLLNACAGGDLTITCLSDPANFQPGAFQPINRGFARTAESPYYASSFGDHIEENRDTLFLNLIYQF
jgi:hypothetical protein